MREPTTKRYWINENLLITTVRDKSFNLAPTLIKIIEAYIQAKRDVFEDFIKDCERIRDLQQEDHSEARDFIKGRLQPNVDARVFEIISYAILKEYYQSQSVFWGWTLEDVGEESLVLYKTGRTNANDGGIDFVMRPLGRFFQVTETVDVKKYFLDIDKIQRFPLTFVVKSTESVEQIRKRIEAGARRIYSISKIVTSYMDCIEEIINIDMLHERFEKVLADGRLAFLIEEVVLQSKVEFNYEE